MPLHFPAAFPEVFARDRPGFDCLLGNPPWEQVVVAKHVWWGIHIPGIRGKPIKEMNDAIARFRPTRTDLETDFERELAHTESMRSVLRRTFPRVGFGLHRSLQGVRVAQLAPGPTINGACRSCPAPWGIAGEGVGTMAQGDR